MLAPRDLPLLPVFVAVAESGSFTAAARRLGLAKSVVSEHVRSLEQRCGMRLMERSTRRLRLTQVGEQVLDAAKDVLASVRSLEQVVEGHREAPSGTLRVTLPLDPSLSAMIAPITAALTRQYPALRVELRLDDAVHDLVSEGLDVALRLGSIVESSYVVKRLASELEIIVASPELADELVKSAAPRDLSGVPWVVHSALPTRASRTFRTARGDKAQIHAPVAISTNTVVAMRDLLLAGAGFGILPQHVVREDILAGRLRHVCEGWFQRKLVLHALLPTRQAPPRVRALLERLPSAASRLGFEPA
jgi:DNA-binding transcriptional LysR family regulator